VILATAIYQVLGLLDHPLIRSPPVFIGFATDNKPYRKSERAKRFGCDSGTQPAERLGDFCCDFGPAM
jgi:hypothetical protein